MSLAITVGEGVQRPQGRMLKLDAGAVEAVAAAVYQLPVAVETWWSPHLWRDNRRAGDRWLATSAIVLDIDYKDDNPTAPADAQAHLAELARGGQFPGSFFHLTPHGARVVFQFADACSDRQAVLAAAAAAHELVAAAIAGTNYGVDPAPTKDLARLFYAPRAIAKGVQRDAEVVVMRREFYSPAELAAAAPKPAPAASSRPRPSTRSHARATYTDAVAAWNADHPLTLPRHSAECPVCHDKGSFGRLPDDEQRWFCWSTDHDGVGLRSDRGHHGDALDLDAFYRGLTAKQVLIDDGYYSPATPRPRDDSPPPMSVPPEAYADDAPPPEAEDAGADVVPIDRGRRMYRNNSYLTCVQIIEANDRDVLGQGARLEFDDMAGRVVLNRRPLEDTDELSVRAEIERRFSGGTDKGGGQKGLKQSLSDVKSAMLQVARGRSFHPVREFLAALKWDGTPRLDAVAEDILGAERTLLNQALVRRYMVSAVARALEPGCKVDTALILVGPTGLGKSTFFRIIGSPWFIDTKLKIDTPKALMTLRRAWIYEWAELEVMRRAEDINEIKAWITSPVDEYVPQYGHHAVEVPRGFVIAGTTESEDFLVDEKGNRRFWPLRITAVHRAALREQRDQLWAEAMALYSEWVRAGADEDEAPWVLSAAEARELDAVHAAFQETDSWGDLVIAWAEKQLSEFTTADVLESAINKPKAQRNRGDDMRIVKILKRAGWRLGNKPEGRSRPWVRK